MKNTYLIKDEFINARLDRWFRRNISELPQALLEKNVRKGYIKVNNEKKKTSYKLKKSDKITTYTFEIKKSITLKSKKNYTATKKDLVKSSEMFIENNENFVVINKPPGIAVQSGTKSKRNIIDILRDSKEFEGYSPFPVHRIDKETTGILIIAKNRKYAQLLTSLFRIRKIHKTYLGIVVGELEKNKGTFIDELVYYEGEKKTTAKAITHYTVLDVSSNYSLLKLNPETGRKHQLRKQLLIHGHPILGDTKYRLIKNYTDKKKSLMLHAYKINFSINKLKYNFLCDPSDDFKKIIKEKHLRISF